jgi:hypothetical protein
MQEMVFDAHDRAFTGLKRTYPRAIYDNMKTAVEASFRRRGSASLYNRRFLQMWSRMCDHFGAPPFRSCVLASSR